MQNANDMHNGVDDLPKERSPVQSLQEMLASPRHSPTAAAWTQAAALAAHQVNSPMWLFCLCVHLFILVLGSLMAEFVEKCLEIYFNCWTVSLSVLPEPIVLSICKAD